MQGYFEIAGECGVITIGVWNTIVEHLTLTTARTDDGTGGNFTVFVKNLSGFIQINGRQVPGDDQIAHIKTTVAGLFDKVTSEPNTFEFSHSNPEILLERIREKAREREKASTFSWEIDDTPICSAEPPGQKLCNNDRNEAYCCTTIGFTPDGAWPSPAYDSFVADGQYPPQYNDKLGTDPLK